MKKETVSKQVFWDGFLFFFNLLIILIKSFKTPIICAFQIGN